MKIAQINLTCGTMSTGRLAKELAEAMDSRGHENLIAFSEGRANYKNSCRFISTPERKLHAVLSRVTGRQGYFSRPATRRLIRRLKAFGPDAVVLHVLHGNCVSLKMLLGYLAKNDVATVAVLHDCWFYTGKCTYYVAADCKKWMDRCGDCPLLHVDNVNPTLWFDRTEVCLRDKRAWFGAIPRLAVVGVSEWVSGEARRSILAGRPVTTIHNWVDREIFRPRASSLREKHGLEGKFVILMAAAFINRKKGYDELVELAKRLPEDWAIVAVGRETLPLPGNVIHIDRTDDAVQLAEYYSMADVCMNTTQYETFGMVTAEAICCGTPAVVYNNTASPELVDGGCGLVVDQARGADGIFEALETIRRRGKASYTDACLRSAARFGKSDAVDRWETLLWSMAEMRK